MCGSSRNPRFNRQRHAPLSAAEINGSSFESIGGIYIPSVVAGINASTGNKENAEEFLRVLFGTEVQDESLRDGFSVRSSSLDKWSGMEKSVSVSMSMGGEGIALEENGQNRQTAI